jgi:hypothetical protein
MSDLSSKKIAALRCEREKLLSELVEVHLLVRGTYLERFSTCSRPNCACHKGKRHGPRSYVVVTRMKNQRQVYIPKDQVEVLRTGVAQYRRLLEIVDRVTSINLELMRGGVLK